MQWGGFVCLCVAWQRTLLSLVDVRFARFDGPISRSFHIPNWTRYYHLDEGRRRERARDEYMDTTCYSGCFVIIIIIGINRNLLEQSKCLLRQLSSLSSYSQINAGQSISEIQLLFSLRRTYNRRRRFRLSRVDRIELNWIELDLHISISSKSSTWVISCNALIKPHI